MPGIPPLTQALSVTTQNRDVQRRAKFFSSQPARLFAGDVKLSI